MRDREVVLLNKIGKVITRFGEPLDLRRRRPFTGKSNGGRFNHLPHFPDFVNFFIRKFRHEKSTPLTLGDQTLAQKPGETFTDGKTADIQFFRPKLFDNPVIRSDFIGQNPVA